MDQQTPSFLRSVTARLSRRRLLSRSLPLATAGAIGATTLTTESKQAHAATRVWVLCTAVEQQDDMLQGTASIIFKSPFLDTSRPVAAKVYISLFGAHNDGAANGPGPFADARILGWYDSGNGYHELTNPGQGLVGLAERNVRQVVAEVTNAASQSVAVLEIYYAATI